jgi:hypothetical protein
MSKLLALALDDLEVGQVKAPALHVMLDVLRLPALTI